MFMMMIKSDAILNYEFVRDNEIISTEGQLQKEPISRTLLGHYSEWPLDQEEHVFWQFFGVTFWVSTQ